MVDARHSKQSPTNGGVHVIHAFEYADAATRNAAILTSADIGKVARQIDNNTFYVIINAGSGSGIFNIILTIASQEQGSVLYFNGSNWVELPPSDDGYVLTTHDISADPTWEEAAIGGGTDHGALTGLADDDHTQYLLVDGTRAMSSDLNLDSNTITNIENVNLNITSPPANSEGRIYYDSTDHVLAVFTDEAEVTHFLGQEGLIRVYNTTGVTIAAGAAVYINGTEVVENRPTIALGRSDAVTTSEIIGLTDHAIENNTFGYVMAWGVIQNEDTSALTAGDAVFLDESIAGAFRLGVPPEGNFDILLGYINRIHATLGSIVLSIHPDLSLPSGDALELVLEARKGSAGTLTAGTVVYISGYNVGQDVVEVEAADNTSSSTMPAIGILRDTITNSTNGFAVISGRLINQDTSADSPGDDLFVGTSGGFTSTRPIGATLVQNIGEVLRSHASLGVIEVFGPDQVNDLPNLAENMIWQGDSNGVPQEVPLLGFHIFWGAAFSDTDDGDFAVCNGRPDSGEITGLSERTEYTFLADCTITEFTYNTQTGDTDTVWKIVVDSVVQATITQTAAKGTQTVSVAITAPADVAIEMDAAGAAPNRCLVGVYAE